MSGLRNAQYAMTVNAKKPSIAEPPASPSRPSVTFTAFVVAKIMNPVQMIHTQSGGSHPGESARVNEMVRAEPRRFIASMSKVKRTGKIFIDYLRNDAEATAIGAYSPRARAGAPVALPIEWGELEPDAPQAPRFGVLEVPKLIRARKRDPWQGFEEARRSLVD